jgi:hypothetical protein
MGRPCCETFPSYLSHPRWWIAPAEGGGVLPQISGKGGILQARIFRSRQERFVPCQNILFQVYTFDQNPTLV